MLTRYFKYTIIFYFKSLHQLSLTIKKNARQTLVSCLITPNTVQLSLCHSTPYNVQEVHKEDQKYLHI